MTYFPLDSNRQIWDSYTMIKTNAERHVRLFAFFFAKTSKIY